MLKGRKFSKVVSHRFAEIKKRYNLKQIELEIVFFCSQTEDQNYKDGISARDICTKLILNKGQVSTALDSLTEKGYLKAIPSKKDKRIIYYKITEKTGPIIEDVRSTGTELTEKLFKGISEEEMELVRGVMKQFGSNMDEIIETEWV